MIADSLDNANLLPDFSFTVSHTVNMVEQAFIVTCEKFLINIESLRTRRKHTDLNENSLTQEFVTQLNRSLRKLDLPMCANREYIDIHNPDANIKRTVDFYFYSSEEEDETRSLFSVEAKRLPMPTQAREREYIIGNDNNGGVERFKQEEHGKGLNECGLLGYVESDTFDTWFTTINSWVQDLSENGTSWTIDEKLIKGQFSNSWAKSFSICNRPSGGKLKLLHFWIYINPHAPAGDALVN